MHRLFYDRRGSELAASGREGKSVSFVTEMKFALQLDCRSRKGDYVAGQIGLPACL